MALRKNDWSLNKEAFDRLLARLDPDRDQAAARYEQIRGKLLSLFRWRGCADPHELADLTFDRVARRVLEGVELRGSDPYPYFHGVALNVFRERRSRPQAVSIEQVPVWRLPPAPANPPAQLAALVKERRLSCLGNCLDSLPLDQRRLLSEYHLAGRAAREQLAARLDYPLNRLRVRVFRMRKALQPCVENCLRRFAESVKYS